MMATFDVIALFGTGNARAMAGGISEALLTTQSGLLVAIPGLYMSIYLNRRAERLEDQLDETVMTIGRLV
jgi:biopolymer transport protein ExbB